MLAVHVTVVLGQILRRLDPGHLEDLAVDPSQVLDHVPIGTDDGSYAPLDPALRAHGIGEKHTLDLRTPLRAGANDEELLGLIRSTWRRREDRYSELRAALGPGADKVEMYYIGG